MKLINTIEKIYIISHPESERRERVLHTIRTLFPRVPYEFVFKHYPDTVERELGNWIGGVEYIPYYEELLTCNHQGYYRRNLSLFFNHMECYKSFMRESLIQSCLVLEDDAIIDNAALLDADIPNARWDAISIGRGLFSDDYMQPRKFVLQRQTNCTEAIIITKEFASKVLNFSCRYLLKFEVDHQLNWVLKSDPNIKYFQAWPAVIRQSSLLEGKSTIALANERELIH